LVTLILICLLVRSSRTWAALQVLCSRLRFMKIHIITPTYRVFTALFCHKAGGWVNYMKCYKAFSCSKANNYAGEMKGGRNQIS
jgi:hypothetical protein